MIWASPSAFSAESSCSVSPSLEIRSQFPPGSTTLKSPHRAVFLSRSCDAWNACDRQLAMRYPQGGSKVTIETVRVRYNDDRSAIRIRRIEAIDAEQMDMDFLERYDRVRVWTDLSVCSLEPERLIERDRFVEVAHRVGTDTYVRSPRRDSFAGAVGAIMQGSGISWRLGSKRARRGDRLSRRPPCCRG